MQRKQRPFYYASEEQFRWLQIIAGKISPDSDLSDISQLKEIAESLDGVKRESGDYGRGSEPGVHNSHTPLTIEPEEGMEGVVDGIGTLILDPLGRESNPLLEKERDVDNRIRRRIRVSGISQKSKRIRPLTKTGE
jgi:hypothetical protein